MCIEALSPGLHHEVSQLCKTSSAASHKRKPQLESKDTEDEEVQHVKL